MPITLVSFHAHPDDEVLLTGGTLARAAAEGHRVVLVTATDGEAGLAADDGDLGARRGDELERAAAALGCARVIRLGYADSGYAGPPRPGSFATLDPTVPAERLAAILREEHAQVLTVYDALGGYGHRDHVQVHRAGVLAAELAGTPVVLEATIDRRPLMRIAAVLARIPWLRNLIPPARFADAFVAHEELTHRVDVRRHLAAKRAAFAAHASQRSGAPVRTVELLRRLPWPIAGLVLGHEWFRERDRTRPHRLLDDVFDSVRSPD